MRRSAASVFVLVFRDILHIQMQEAAGPADAAFGRQRHLGVASLAGPWRLFLHAAWYTCDRPEGGKGARWNRSKKGISLRERPSPLFVGCEIKLSRGWPPCLRGI